MTACHRFTASELANYRENNATPHRKIVTAQVAEAKLPPIVRRDAAGDVAESDLQTKMMHGENS